MSKKDSSILFVVIADSHIRLEETTSRHDFYPSNQFANARNRYIVQKINEFGPKLVIHLGDIVYPIPALHTHETVVQMAKELYQRLESKLYIVPGNHDVGDKLNAWVPAPVITEKSYEIFEKYWGKNYLSFNEGDCHFVLFNSPVLNSGLSLEKEQRKWLERDLATNKKEGKRVFLFTHYPPYLNNPQEAEHYDNIGEPARSWLLSLLEKYNVEAVFAAHVHNFFYNRYLNTDIYVLPSVTFVRPDFSELFHIGPAAEYGRNDIGKLGFFVVRVDKAGHRIEFIRTHGLTDEQEEAVVTRPLSLSGIQTEERSTPVGVFLRHAWATPIEIPYDNLDEFTRKSVRNDYLLQALWELHIRKLRVPLGDLSDNNIRKRMRVLRTLGHKFTVFSVGVPSSPMKETIVRHHELVDFWEVIVSMDQIPEAIRSIQDIKQKVAVRTVLSKLDTIADQRRGEEFQFSHFPSHGFRFEECDLLSTSITKYDSAKVLDGFVFRLPPNINPWEGIRAAENLAEELDMVVMVHIQLPRESEGVAFEQDHEISDRIAETLAAALVVRGVEIFLDTFVDHDRAYFPRNGLLDRRYNPRPSYYVFRHLKHAFRYQHEIKMTKIEADTGIRAFAMDTSQFRCILLISEEVGNSTELDLAWFPRSKSQEGMGKWMDLQTGKVREVHWKQSVTQSDLITINIPSVCFNPALLILEASDGSDKV